MDSLVTWAQPQIERFLPVDDQSAKEIVTYSTSLSKEAGAEHLKTLLGDSAQAFEFISSFNSRRPDAVDANRSSSNRGNVPVQTSNSSGGGGGVASRKKHLNRVKAPLHTAGPVRRPENYGDTSAGYIKTSTEQDYVPRVTSSNLHASSGFPSLSEVPDAVQSPIPSQESTLSPSSSQTSKLAESPRLPPSAAGSLISDLPNVKSKRFKKPARQPGASTLHKASTTSSLNDLSAAISALELSTNPSLSSEQRRCQCNASLHPLFEPAPNCLSCGKIICALEGLQPCSFCNAPVLSQEQVHTMLRTLKEERGQEKMAVHNAAVNHSGRSNPMFRSTGETSESSGDETSTAAVRARAHRDKLLGFQQENARRTKIHDEAADYDTSITPGATQWMSPVQRAAALKKQQNYLRESEEAAKPEWEKKKTVMSMSIQNGKLVRTYETTQREAPTEVKGAEDASGPDDGDENDLRQKYPLEGKLSQNPLLSGGGLIRPVWRGRDDDLYKGKGKAGERRRQSQPTWRTVQDDHGDNEQWILDGGVHGFSEGSK